MPEIEVKLTEDELHDIVIAIEALTYSIREDYKKDRVDHEGYSKASIKYHNLWLKLMNAKLKKSFMPDKFILRDEE